MRERPCVRCGERPRHDDSFICAECADNPLAAAEVRAAVRRAGPKHEDQRAYLMARKGWVGGWSLRRGSVRLGA